MSKKFQTGEAKETMYVKLWRDVLPYLDGPASNAFWTIPAIPNSAITQVLKARYGQLWTMRKAFQYRMPYKPGQPVARNGNCPLCGEEDSIGHLLGKCGHKDMAASYIERHNEAARLILGETLKGKHGNRIVCADVGRKDKVQHLHVEHTRIPKTILSDKTILEYGLTLGDRERIRPDALILEYNQPQEANQRTRKRDRHGDKKIPNIKQAGEEVRPCKAYLVEVGYTSETRYCTKLQEKLEQHSVLVKLLEREGYDPVVIPIILGTTGGIFNSNNEAFDTLGVSTNRQKVLAQRLHIHSISTLHALVKLRRQLENTSMQPPKRRHKKPPDR